jgi:multicomponent Na+:H+ antiporter subunit G
MFSNVLVSLLMLAGAGFMLLAAIGMVRFPDLFSRMQSSTKAGTLGAGCVLAAVALDRADAGVTANVGLIIAFLIVTAPTAAHRLARAAYRVGTPLWEGTLSDELREALEREDKPGEEPR